MTDRHELEQRLDKAEWVLNNAGFRRCDIAACNCGSWHQVGGFKARFDEIKEAVEEADYSTNGKTLLDVVKEVITDAKRTGDPAQAVGVRLATIEECAKIAEYNGWERTAEQIRALASQPSPAATVEVSKEIPADMRLIVSALKGRFFECGGHMREMSENEAFDIALALRRAREDHEWCSAGNGDLNELDRVIGIFGRATTETYQDPSDRYDAIKFVRDYLFELRQRLTTAAPQTVAVTETCADCAQPIGTNDKFFSCFEDSSHPLGLEAMIGRPYGQEKADVACLAPESCRWPTCECGRDA